MWVPCWLCGPLTCCCFSRGGALGGCSCRPLEPLGSRSSPPLGWVAAPGVALPAHSSGWGAGIRGWMALLTPALWEQGMTPASPRPSRVYGVAKPPALTLLPAAAIAATSAAAAPAADNTTRFVEAWAERLERDEKVRTGRRALAVWEGKGKGEGAGCWLAAYGSPVAGLAAAA